METILDAPEFDYGNTLQGKWLNVNKNAILQLFILQTDSIIESMQHSISSFPFWWPSWTPS